MRQRRQAIAGGIALLAALVATPTVAVEPASDRCDAAAAEAHRIDDGMREGTAVALLDGHRFACTTSPLFLSTYSRLLVRAQRYADAYALLDDERSRAALGDLAYLRERAWVDAHAGQYDSAIAAGRGMIAQWPEWPDGYWIVAETFQLQNRSADADAIWREYDAARSRVDTGAWVRSLDPPQFFVVLVALLLASVGGALLARFGLRRARHVGTLPTALIRSAAQGYVELKGMAQAEDGRLLHSPRSATPCLWYDYTEFRRTTENGRERTRIVARRTAGVPFLLRDATGEVTVDPEGAEFDVRERKVERFGNSTHHEALVMEGESVYAIGWFSSQAADAGRQRHRLSRPGDGRPYLVSTHSEERQLLVARLAAGGGVVTLIVALAALAWLVQQRWWVQSLPMAF